MAETLTYDAATDSISKEGSLTTDEQDSLKVGEAMIEEQEQLLAGKYKNAQELESAYVELQKKLGEQNNKDSGETGELTTPKSEEATEETTEAEEKSEETGILETVWDEAAKGEYSKETLEKLQGLSSTDIANEYLEYRKNNQPPQITDADAEQLKNLAGGEQGYADMLAWAERNLNEQEVAMFDQVMEQGNPLAAFFAVRSLAYRYEDARGVEGKMVTGNAPKTSGDQFRSQAEVVKAMSDSRYERDPAYRQDIMRKLERSNIDF